MPSLETLQNTDLAEEIEAINAIYEPDTITITSTPPATTSTSTSTSTSTPSNTDKATTLDLGSAGSSAPVASTVTLQIPNQVNLSLVVGFERSYPETRPRIVGTASTGTGSRGEGRVAVDVVEDIVQRIHQPGAVCLFEVINEAIEAFEELNLGGKEEANQAAEAAEDHGEDDDGDTATAAAATNTIEDMATLSLRDNFGLDAPPAWIMSDVVNEKKSIFVGRAAAVTSLDQAQAFLDHLLATEKKVAAATHNISAWRIREKRTTSSNGNGESDDMMIVQDSDDDGETAAGGRLLHLMQLMDVWDVVVVVTRWYGGVQLGPDRFRIINAVGRDALIKGGFSHKGTTDNSNSTKGKKKKGKK